jgi:hypothetical protein
MTTYSITLRVWGHADRRLPAYRQYRIPAWTREEAIKLARDRALAEGWGSSAVSWCMPAFITEMTK